MVLSEIFSSLTRPDLDGMKHSIIESGPQSYSFGRRGDLDDQLAMLYREFSGRSFLEFYHSGLTIMLRREIEPDVNWTRFEQLWRTYTQFLLKNLDSRWLVSACDTIVDYSTNATEIAWGMGGSIFMNTIKLYETERFAAGCSSENYMPIRGRAALFDGISAFVIGSGDMVYNLMARLRRQASGGYVAQQITQELMSRANTNDTVFRRFSRLHQQPKTRWPEE